MYSHNHTMVAHVHWRRRMDVEQMISSLENLDRAELGRLEEALDRRLRKLW